MNENTFVNSFFSTPLSHCFSLLSASLHSKPFQNNYKHCEIIDNYFKVFFVEIQMKKEILKSVCAPKSLSQSPRWPEYITVINKICK